MLGPRFKKARTGQFDVYKALQEFQSRNRTVQEFNPNHDEKGRFTTGDGGASGSSSSPKDSSGGSSSSDIRAKQNLIDSKLDSAVNLHGKPVKLSDENREAMSKGLNTIPQEHLQNLNRVVIHDGSEIPLQGAKNVNGLYAESNLPNEVISSINDRHGYDLKHRDLALATGRTPEQVYSSTVHESAHVRWDNMKNFGTEEDKQRVAAFADAHESYFKSASKNDIENFKNAYGHYGLPTGRDNDIDKQEAFTTMSQAYYGSPRDDTILRKQVGRDISGEEYLSEAETRWPRLKGLNEAFRKMIINTG